MNPLELKLVGRLISQAIQGHQSQFLDNSLQIEIRHQLLACLPSFHHSRIEVFDPVFVFSAFGLRSLGRYHCLFWRFVFAGYLDFLRYDSAPGNAATEPLGYGAV